MPRIMELKALDGSIYTVFSMDYDIIEKVPPVMWYGSYAFFQLIHMMDVPEKVARKMSIEVVRGWMDTPCPVFMRALLDTDNKKDQEGLLRDQFITPENLICWALQSGNQGGLFSQYIYNAGTPPELKGRTPLMVDATNPDEIITIGKTVLSKAALLHLVENQKRVIAQFIDLPNGRWYCFYRTHRGLAGRESGNHGQHMHFISSAYGIYRDSLVEGFMNGKCPGNGFHIHLNGYWDNEKGHM